MIDCEKLSCTIFFFCINTLPQVATLPGVVDCFSLRGFYPCKNIGVLIFDLVV
jgi:hypothetical protein